MAKLLIHPALADALTRGTWSRDRSIIVDRYLAQQDVRNAGSPIPYLGKRTGKP